MKNKATGTNGYRRVMNALQGIKNDRPPLGLLLSLYGKNYVDCSLTDYYSVPERYAEGQAQIAAKFAPDIITTPLVFAFEGEAYGSTLKYFENSPPQLKKPAIQSHSQINKLQVPKGFGKSKEYLLNTAELLASSYKNEKLIAGITISNIDSPALIMGIEGWLDTLLFHPQSAHDLLNKITDHFVEYANAFFQKGIDILVVPNIFSNPSIITGTIMADITLGYLKLALEQLNGPVVIHHGGANLGDFLHFFCDLPNVVGFVVSSADDLNTSRNKIGNKLLLGNLDMKTISNRTPDSITKHTNDILNDRITDNNFILFSSNADIMLDTPEENIYAVCDALKNRET